MAVLDPALAILDETDSGLDIDALQDRGRRRQRLRDAGRAFIVHHALPAPARATSSPTSSTCWPRDASSARATRALARELEAQGLRLARGRRGRAGAGRERRMIAADAQTRAVAARLSDRGLELERHGPSWLAPAAPGEPGALRRSRSRLRRGGRLDDATARDARASSSLAAPAPPAGDVTALPDAALALDPRRIASCSSTGGRLRTCAISRPTRRARGSRGLSAALAEAPERLAGPLGRRATRRAAGVRRRSTPPWPRTAWSWSCRRERRSSGRSTSCTSRRAGAEPRAIHTRTIVVAGRSSHARVGRDPRRARRGAVLDERAWRTSRSATNASLEHYRMQLEGPGAYPRLVDREPAGGVTAATRRSASTSAGASCATT